MPTPCSSVGCADAVCCAQTGSALSATAHAHKIAALIILVTLLTSSRSVCAITSRFARGSAARRTFRCALVFLGSRRHRHALLQQQIHGTIDWEPHGPALAVLPRI